MFVVDQHTTEVDTVVAVRCRSGWRLVPNTSYDVGITLASIISEDPDEWTEISGFWPRYRTRVVPEYFSAVDYEDSTEAEVVDYLQRLRPEVAWLYIDLIEKRVCSRNFNRLRPNVTLALAEDERGNTDCPVSVCIPPWWEVEGEAELGAICSARETRLRVPRGHRDVLWGEPLATGLAGLILKTFSSSEWQSSGAATDADKRYRFTVEVHRDWLMNGRDDLEGRTPRDCLHGALDWIDSLCDSQRVRIQAGEPMVAISRETKTFREAAPGREEVGVYFDLCREMIAGGWQWCSEAGNPAAANAIERLAEHLLTVKDRWMVRPFEGGGSPAAIVECSRRRVARGTGFSVVGMAQEDVTEDHLYDCECPVCELMQQSSFGPSFSMFDGHYLELDEEFAFSLCSTKEEWDLEQKAISRWESFDADEPTSDFRVRMEPVEPMQPMVDSVEHSSVWKTVGPGFQPLFPDDFSNQPSTSGLPFLRLGFMLSEIVIEIRAACEAKDYLDRELSLELVPSRLTSLLSEFRQGSWEERPAIVRRFNQLLELAAEAIPSLTSRVADFQSHLDELLLTGRPQLSERFDRH